MVKTIFTRLKPCATDILPLRGMPYRKLPACEDDTSLYLSLSGIGYWLFPYVPEEQNVGHLPLRGMSNRHKVMFRRNKISVGQGFNPGKRCPNNTAPEERDIYFHAMCLCLFHPDGVGWLLNRFHMVKTIFTRLKPCATDILPLRGMPNRTLSACEDDTSQNLTPSGYRLLAFLPCSGGTTCWSFTPPRYV